MAAVHQIHDDIDSFMSGDGALDIAGLHTFHETTRETMLPALQELERADSEDVVVESVRSWMIRIEHGLSASESYLLFRFDAVKGPAYAEDAVYWFDQADETWNHGVLIGLEISQACD